jgi:hypothetical protein
MMRAGGFRSPSRLSLRGRVDDRRVVEGSTPTAIRQFDLVTLLIGVNNQYRGRSPDEYREQFRRWCPSSRVCRLARPASLGVDAGLGLTPSRAIRTRPGYDRERDRRFNAVARDEAARRRGFVDVTQCRAPGRGAGTDCVMDCTRLPDVRTLGSSHSPVAIEAIG